MSNDTYIYLFIRTDLSHAQQIIQMAHAVDSLNKPVSNPVSNMVLFGIKSEEDLMLVDMELEDKEVLHEVFYEPDIRSCTALATYPMKGDSRKMFSKYKMLK